MELGKPYTHTHTHDISKKYRAVWLDKNYSSKAKMSDLSEIYIADFHLINGNQTQLVNICWMILNIVTE